MAVKTLQRIREFIPKAGNADREEGQEAIKVFLRSVDVYTKQTHIREFAGKDGKQLMADMMSPEGSKKIKDILDKVVARFENLEVTDEPTKEQIASSTIPTPRAATLKDVWEIGEWSLCLEIFMDVINHSQLTREETKNSASQSGLPPTPEAQVH